MKILFFIGKLYGGGAERVATTIMNHLSKKHSVIAAISNDKKPSYPINSKIVIWKYTYNGVNNTIRIIDRTLKIHKIINDTKPDLIISFITELNGCVLLANCLKKRKIIVSERTTIQRQMSFWRSFSRHILYRFASKVVLVSKNDYNYANWLENKTVIYNPLFFPITDNYEKRGKRIITIGDLCRWHVKGFDLLIQAWSKIAPLYPDWKLQFVGATDNNPITEMVKSYGLENQSDFLGWTDEIDKVLQTKSIYVLSSRHEGCPNSLIEAMSQGCACVAFDCKTGPNEIITDGVSGLLAQNGDIDDLAAKLQRLIDDEHLRQRLAKGATEEVRRFEKGKIMRQWDDLIDEVTLNTRKIGNT